MKTKKNLIMKNGIIVSLMVTGAGIIGRFIGFKEGKNVLNDPTAVSKALRSFKNKK